MLTTTIQFVLGGIRCPKVGRSADDKSDPFGVEALEFVSNRILQRDVEIEVEGTDKTGGFIGTLWLGKENIAVSLLEEGLASVHSYSADQSAYTTQLYSAENKAKTLVKNVNTTIAYSFTRTCVIYSVKQ